MCILRFSFSLSSCYVVIVIRIQHFVHIFYFLSTVVVHSEFSETFVRYQNMSRTTATTTNYGRKMEANENVTTTTTMTIYESTDEQLERARAHNTVYRRTEDKDQTRTLHSTEQNEDEKRARKKNDDAEYNGFWLCVSSCVLYYSCSSSN